MVECLLSLALVKMSDDLLTCYHGTDLRNVETIITEGFRASSGIKEWLGKGAYFFVDGCGVGEENARLWAVSNPRYSSPRFEEYAVLKFKIRQLDWLDLRTEEHLLAFNRLRRGVDRAIQEYLLPESHLTDVALLETLIKDFDIEAIIMNFYIRDSRKVSSRVPNSAVLCIPGGVPPVDIIGLEVVCSGRVSAHPPLSK